MANLWNAFIADLDATGVVVAALIALAGVLLSALVSAVVSRRATYIKTVTAERAKWIDKLRTNISTLVGELGYLDFKIYRDESYADGKEHDELVRRVGALVTVVRLQLNPEGPIDANIIALLDVMPEMAGNQEYRLLEALFIRHVQWLLKVEWEKVKFESRGFSRYIWEWPKRVLRQRSYKNFSDTGGSIASYVRR